MTIRINDKIKKRLQRIALLSLAAFIVGACIALLELHAQTTRLTNGDAPVPVAGMAIESRFTLTDHTGQAVTQDTYKGQNTLIYFGFTYCPAICPTELRKISEVMDLLPTDVSKNVQPLFITVDPERDTVPVMAGYVSLFHSKMIGLTGTMDQITDTKNAFKVFARKAEDPDLSDYTMDHSSYIYFMDEHGALKGMYRIKDTAAYIARDIERIVGSMNAVP